jgi:elongation factor P--(R)-beta-lysine ligase
MAPDVNDKWRPAASFAALKLRARILARIRAYFEESALLEVETPVLSRAATTDPHLHSFTARSLAPGDPTTPRYLHTSPEFAMKRLLAAGSGSIYQICKVFRGGESGRRHNAEFTLLEWYRVGFTYHQLMDDVEALVTAVLERAASPPSERISYRDAFSRYAGIDTFTATIAKHVECARRHDIAVSGLAESDLDTWRNLLLTHVIEPQLDRGRLTFLYDYPASQAALARVRAGDPPLAERFELYVGAMELANGFGELANAEEQRRRFENHRSVRAAQELAAVPGDDFLLAALRHGLPDCSGVALGVDRLVMLAANATSIEEVLPFPFDRA